MSMDKPTISDAQQDSAAVQPKKTYVAPELRTYGSVSMLTMAKGSTQLDGKVLNLVMGPSDRSIKENIVQIGVHPLGIGLYLFDYKPEYRAACGHGRRLGVMADEVETVRPEAVVVHADGYKMVDYGMLN